MHICMYVTTYLYVFQCNIHASYSAGRCALAARLLRACCAFAVRLLCGRHTFAARSLHCTSRRAVVERSPRGQRMHMRRHFANFIRISSITVAGCNKRASVAHCRLNWCLCIVDCQWFMSKLPSRAGAAMGNRTIPVEEVTLHTANKELKCIQKKTPQESGRTQFSKVDERQVEY